MKVQSEDTMNTGPFRQEKANLYPARNTIASGKSFSKPIESYWLRTTTPQGLAPTGTFFLTVLPANSTTDTLLDGPFAE